MLKPKANEVWKVKIFHRVYWRNATIKLVARNPYRPGFGWLYHYKISSGLWSEGTECRSAAHVKFLRKLEG